MPPDPLWYNADMHDAKLPTVPPTPILPPDMEAGAKVPWQVRLAASLTGIVGVLSLAWVAFFGIVFHFRRWYGSLGTELANIWIPLAAGLLCIWVAADLRRMRWRARHLAGRAPAFVVLAHVGSHIIWLATSGVQDYDGYSIFALAAQICDVQQFVAPAIFLILGIVNWALFTQPDGSERFEWRQG